MEEGQAVLAGDGPKGDGLELAAAGQGIPIRAKGHPVDRAGVLGQSRAADVAGGVRRSRRLSDPPRWRKRPFDRLRTQLRPARKRPRNRGERSGGKWRYGRLV